MEASLRVFYEIGLTMHEPFCICSDFSFIIDYFFWSAADALFVTVEERPTRTAEGKSLLPILSMCTFNNWTRLSWSDFFFEIEFSLLFVFESFKFSWDYFSYIITELYLKGEGLCLMTEG